MLQLSNQRPMGLWYINSPLWGDNLKLYNQQYNII